MVLPAAVVGPTHMATAPLPAGVLALVALAAAVGEAEASGAESAPPGMAFPALLPALIPGMLVLVERRHGVATVVGTMGFDLNKDPLLTWILVAPTPADTDLVAAAEAPRAVAAAARASGFGYTATALGRVPEQAAQIHRDSTLASLPSHQSLAIGSEACLTSLHMATGALCLPLAMCLCRRRRATRRVAAIQARRRQTGRSDL